MYASGSFEFVPRNAYVHRLDLGLCSHPKEFLRNGIRTNATPKGKISSTGDLKEDRPTTVHHAEQRTQHITDGAIPAPSVVDKSTLRHVRDSPPPPPLPAHRLVTTLPFTLGWWWFAGCQAQSHDNPTVAVQ